MLLQHTSTSIKTHLNQIAAAVDVVAIAAAAAAG